MVGNKPAFWQWNSPLPYLFGGLGLMFTLICIALVILACSYRRSSPPGDEDDEKSVKPVQSPAPTSTPPQIVVIMAGDENPTHLAVPVGPVLCANCSACRGGYGGGEADGEASPSDMQLV